MLIEPSFITLLSAYTLYPVKAPASAVLPFIVYNIIGDVPNDLIGLDRVNTVTRESFSLAYHAETYSGARVGADAIKVILEAWSSAVVYSSSPSSDGVIGDVSVERVYDFAYRNDI